MLELIRKKIPREEQLAQLAEEAAELGHAALKLRRTYGDINPTPVTQDEAFSALLEEIADVMLLIDVLELHQVRYEYELIMQAKLARWVQRLYAAEEG